jgi:hypothetical protein
MNKGREAEGRNLAYGPHAETRAGRIWDVCTMDTAPASSLHEECRMAHRLVVNH